MSHMATVVGSGESRFWCTSCTGWAQAAVCMHMCCGSRGRVNLPVRTFSACGHGTCGAHRRRLACSSEVSQVAAGSGFLCLCVWNCGAHTGGVWHAEMEVSAATAGSMLIRSCARALPSRVEAHLPLTQAAIGIHIGAERSRGMAREGWFAANVSRSRRPLMSAVPGPNPPPTYPHTNAPCSTACPRLHGSLRPQCRGWASR